MKVVKTCFCFISLVLSAGCYIVDPGPTVIATKGEVWPKPQEQEMSGDYFILRPQMFQFKLIVGNECTILEDAFVRYNKIISGHYEIVIRNKKFLDYKQQRKYWFKDNNIGYLDYLNVSLRGSCDDAAYPSVNMVENYHLKLSPEFAELTANSTWGILRGLETFSQLIYVGEDAMSLRINSTNIYDFPRFLHRGLLIDTSRHFIPLDKILSNLDAMAYNKLNVFHWHITDDQSFPYYSKRFPELSEMGAYQVSKVYSLSDVQTVIEYARIRGIRVIPEFDSPGHTRSWGVSHRNLLTECYESEQKSGKLGPIDPTNDDVYKFLRDLFTEIVEVFPDQYVHLGGDEVGFECWESNPDVNTFMKNHNMTDDYEALESYYIQKLINIVHELNSSVFVWEEVFENGVQLPDQTIVHVWKGDWQGTLFNITDTGREALLSACWYLDSLGWGGDWQKYYKCEPFDFSNEEEKRKLLLGGEACMWAEAVNEYNIISRVWPRASAVAERLWSNEYVNDTTDAAKRLEEHTCRMNRRGIGAQPPNSAGYCP